MTSTSRWVNCGAGRAAWSGVSIVDSLIGSVETNRGSHLRGDRVELAEAMQTQRAIRRLRSDPVEDDVILRCLELATRAPSGGNQQGWEWIIVRDRDKKRALASQYRRAWSIYGGIGRRLY